MCASDFSPLDVKLVKEHVLTWLDRICMSSSDEVVAANDNADDDTFVTANVVVPFDITGVVLRFSCLARGVLAEVF